MKALLFVSMFVLVLDLSRGFSWSTYSARLQHSPPIRYDEISREIAGFSAQAELLNLRGLILPNGVTEIRIWRGGGLAYPRCFILKVNTTGKWVAYLVAPKVVNNRAVFRSNHQPIYLRTPLESPSSGWDSFADYLKRVGLFSENGFALDSTFAPYPDEEAIFIELKTGARYKVASYLESTKSQDGLKAFSLCQRVEDEFAERLGCGH